MENTYKHLKPYERPDSYMGPDYYDYYPFLGRSRDSDYIEEDNFKEGLEAIGGESDTVLVIRDSHWAVGWVETIYIHKKDKNALKIADNILEKLSQYPILNDDTCSQREWDGVMDFWDTLDAQEKKELCKEYHCTLPKDKTFPVDDNGSLFEYLRG